jgi:ABC-type multidrug transport system fused ATPase/permease subunit
MNSVERVVFYATGVEQEAPHELPDMKPSASWPADGRVELRNVVFKYRPELPAVLKDISMTVNAGEKIGIVGRYFKNLGCCWVTDHDVHVELVLGRAQ